MNIIGGAGYAAGITSVNKGIIENCYNIGAINVFSDREVCFGGGIVGGQYGTIKKCYNIGEINITTNERGDNTKGAIVSIDLELENSIIKECIYNAQDILGIGKNGTGEKLKETILDRNLTLNKILELINK